MNWKEFADEIKGELQSTTNGFVDGDTQSNKIVWECDRELLVIEKKVRRSYGGSSHLNHEKLEFYYATKQITFDKLRITRKPLLFRLGKKSIYQFNFEGKSLKNTVLEDLVAVLEYLLKYPKSELIMDSKVIKFKSECIGKMNEDLNEIYVSMEKFKSILVKHNLL